MATMIVLVELKDRLVRCLEDKRRFHICVERHLDENMYPAQ